MAKKAAKKAAKRTIKKAIKKPAKRATGSQVVRAMKKASVRKAARSAARKASGKAAPAASPKRSRKTAKKGASRMKAKGGRPPFTPTDGDRARVETLAGLGLKQTEIRLLVENPSTGKPISLETLTGNFQDELARGGPVAHEKVAQSIFDRAVDLHHPQGATAAIFYAKCRMGWKEHNVVEVENKSGVLVPPAATSPEEWIAAANDAAEKAKKPGGQE